MRGEADLMLAGGADAAIIPSGVGGFIACKALSKNNAAPEQASRPWDKGRDGFVMGEGAGVLPPGCVTNAACDLRSSTAHQRVCRVRPVLQILPCPQQWPVS